MSEPVETPRRNLTGAVVPAVAVAALAALGALLLVVRNGQQGPAATPVVENCILEGAEEVGGPIALIDSNGAAVTQADFAGAPAVIYFGFTHCPDICPTSMYALAEALAQPGGYDVQPVLITVDPERDTPERLREYLGYFDKGFIGVTGTPAQLSAVREAYGILATRAENKDAPDGYLVHHSTYVYLIDRAGLLRALVPYGKSASDIAHDVKILLQEQAGK